ncbi:hypothetical protein [Pseudomonas sp. LD120]|uniref:hypothetical protein n=1 Tax=Pseudomonas sp. LD120 TaxID=485751 RepID=UPI0013598E14|nr:hypothetical protein [Pseudomonas sp. LD120]KAF0862207.1 hypothetical protein PLD_16025 [Pseudomonas sp. LD120]
MPEAKVLTISEFGGVVLILGAESKQMGHKECLQLLESIEDVHNHLISLLTFLIDCERKQQCPKKMMLVRWERLLTRSIDLEGSLPGSHVSAYQYALSEFQHGISELEPIAKNFLVAKGLGS